MEVTNARLAILVTKLLLSKCFGENMGNQVVGVDMTYGNVVRKKLVTNTVAIDVNMCHLLTKDWIRSNVKGYLVTNRRGA